MSPNVDDDIASAQYLVHIYTATVKKARLSLDLVNRRMMRISWKNMKATREILHVPRLKQNILIGMVKERKAKYFGYINRHLSILRDLVLQSTFELGEDTLIDRPVQVFKCVIHEIF